MNLSVLLNLDSIVYLIMVIYFIAHLPAFIMLGIGIGIRKEKKTRSKNLIIGALIYFIVGGGICGSILLT